MRLLKSDNKNWTNYSPLIYINTGYIIGKYIFDDGYWYRDENKNLIKRIINIVNNKYYL